MKTALILLPLLTGLAAGQTNPPAPGKPIGIITNRVAVSPAIIQRIIYLESKAAAADAKRDAILKQRLERNARNRLAIPAGKAEPHFIPAEDRQIKALEKEAASYRLEAYDLRRRHHLPEPPASKAKRK